MATRLALATRVRRQPLAHPFVHHLVSRRRIRQVLGGIWLLDGALQLQPSMFTSNLVTGIMQPATQGQPALVAASIQPIVNLTAHHVVAINAMIALIQIALGVCLLSGKYVRQALLASLGWAFVVWYGGEGMGMLLTGQASALTGAPGPVLLYAILALVAYPSDSGELLPRRQLQLVLAGFWAFAAALQLQPYWWHAHQISQAIAANGGDGTLQGSIVGPSLAGLSRITGEGELLLNASFIVIALGLAVGLTVVRTEWTRALLVGSIAVSALLWWATQGFGQLLTGAATDVNSGPLLILMALACWPRSLDAVNRAGSAREQAHEDPVGAALVL